MNDRFKFRCWDEQIKKMRYGDIQLSCEGKPFILEAHANGLKAADIDNIVIMQCTGLKDKTGKLIYEGDIVDCYVSTKKLYRYPVKYEIGSLC